MDGIWMSAGVCQVRTRVRSDLANDRFESKADLRPRRRYVRFTLMN